LLEIIRGRRPRRIARYPIEQKNQIDKAGRDLFTSPDWQRRWGICELLRAVGAEFIDLSLTSWRGFLNAWLNKI
jgi:hypothetical protein